MDVKPDPSALDVVPMTFLRDVLQTAGPNILTIVNISASGGIPLHIFKLPLFQPQ